MLRKEIMLPNYSFCLVNLSSSILKRFNVLDEHITMKELDSILKKYKKIVYIFFDGMGSYIMDKHLDKDSFLQSHKVNDFSSVFPPTTAAATTSFLACKNPNETGWIGWHSYFKDIDKDLVLFRNSGYYDDVKLEEDYIGKTLPYIDILERIKDNGYRTKRINSFDGLDDLQDFEKEIIDFVNQKDEGFMYAYYTNPDHFMHLYGTTSSEVHNIILDINNTMIDLYNQLDEDSLVIVSADHGHIDTDLINLALDEELKKLLVVKPYCDTRSIMFRVNDKDKFKQVFKHKYGGAFDLYSKEEVIEMKLFGDKENSKIFLDELGDFLAIAKANYYMDYQEQETIIFKSCHSGYTKEEMTIPLILIHK